jgi:hypothetical protein
MEEYPYVTSAPMDDIIVHQLASWMDSTQRHIQDLVSRFLHSPFSTNSLHRLSIIILLFERISRSLRQATSTAEVSNLESRQHTIPIKDSTSVDAVDHLGLLMAISFAFLFTRSDGAYIIIAITFSIICLGSLLPMALWGLMSLLLFNSICWEAMLSVLVLVWLSGVVCSSMAHNVIMIAIMHDTVSNY